MLFREAFLTSNDNSILSTGNSRISKNSFFVECRLPYSMGGYSPALKLDDKTTGKYRIFLSNGNSKKDMGFLERKGDGTYRYFIQDCGMDFSKYEKVSVYLNGKLVLCGKYKYPYGFY